MKPAAGQRDLPLAASIPIRSEYNYITRCAVDEPLSAADANRKFSAILRGAREGRTYIVTSHGRPVARIVPAGQSGGTTDRARAALIARLEKQPVVTAGRWTRDELYEDDR